MVLPESKSLLLWGVQGQILLGTTSLYTHLVLLENRPSYRDDYRDVPALH